MSMMKPKFDLHANFKPLGYAISKNTSFEIGVGHCAMQDRTCKRHLKMNHKKQSDCCQLKIFKPSLGRLPKIFLQKKNYVKIARVGCARAAQG